MVEQTDAIAKTTITPLSNKAQGIVIDSNTLGVRNRPQVLCIVSRNRRPKVEALDATQYGSRQFVNIGRCQDKNDMLRGFLERLEQGVKCRFTEHMNFVNDINLFFGTTRCYLDSLA